MNVTLDLSTVVLTVVSIGVGWFVWRGTEPAAPATPGAPVAGMTTGERLVAALTAAVAVITIGSFAVQGVKSVELPDGRPGPTAAVTGPAPTSPDAMSGK
ncbi:hypothetical protein ACMZ5F_11845 [Streptomyces rhizosphaericola]|uniref:hypothetical protein n=1 Tax=Streptomyces TaxID=1883 RepID=UPI000490B35B|nr:MULTISPECIES: hypothetical protein [unclassified Streptomyces]MYT93405.1 hypothetical protein [Streptomyces sp. SID8359]